MDAWLTAARDRLAETAGTSPTELDLTPDTEATLLNLARIAARESGARTNAPLLCYLLGRADRGSSLDELAAAVRSLAPPPAPG